MTAIIAKILAAFVQQIWNVLFFWLEKRQKQLMESNPEPYTRLLFANPILASQVGNKKIFEPDYWLGHRLPDNCEFIEEESFLPFEDACNYIKKTNRRIILNIGDSSTSGWDSKVVMINKKIIEKGNKEIILPFFRFKTYSNFLRDILHESNSDIFVLNAGVPAHTSLQGSRLLRRLLKAFSKKNIKIDFITIYYGNNDSCWNGDLEDINVIPRKPNSFVNLFVGEIYNRSLLWKTIIARFIRRRATRRQNLQLKTRVSVADYEYCLMQIIKTCCKYGAIPILIEPPVPLFWEPGRRISNEVIDWSENVHGPNAYEVLERLESAKHLWDLGRQEIAKNGITNSARELLRFAKENDYLIPRIKESYVLAIRNLANKYNVPLVQIKLPEDVDDSRYFLDYCHPNENLHKMIAQRIFDLIMKYEEKEAISLVKNIDHLIPQISNLSTNGRIKRRRTEDIEYLSDKIYTLY